MATQMRKARHVSHFSVAANIIQMTALMMGRTGTKGTLNAVFIFGCFFRSMITAIEITVKAASVPMLTKLASVDKLTKPTIHAATAPVSQVLATGVFDFG